MKNLIYTMLLTTLGLIGCNSQEKTGDDHEIHAIAVTQWTEKMEIFMEYEPAIVGQEIKFITHLTTMSDFQPVREGKVILNFKPANGTTITIEKNELLREGIFTPTSTFESPGEFDFSLQYQGTKTNESFAIGSFTVYPSIDAIPEHEEEPPGEEITFLKEQQWKIDFATEEALPQMVKSANLILIVLS